MEQPALCRSEILLWHSRRHCLQHYRGACIAHGVQDGASDSDARLLRSVATAAHLRSEPSYAGMVGGMLRWEGRGSVGVTGETGASVMKGFGAGFSSARGARQAQLQAYSTGHTE